MRRFARGLLNTLIVLSVLSCLTALVFFSSSFLSELQLTIVRGIVTACAIPAAIAIQLAANRRKARRAAAASSRCAQCAYDLTGNVSGICPECGTAVPEPGDGTAYQPRRGDGM